jgi:hypothetical protein
MARDKPLIWVGWKQEYFWLSDWRSGIALIRSNKILWLRSLNHLRGGAINPQRIVA